MRVLVLLGFLLLTSCAGTSSSPPAASREADEAQLLAMHAAGLKAHLESNVDSLLSHEADDFVLVNRGALSSPPMADRKAVLGPYLAASRFEYYRDRKAPVVKVSQDGTLGWVAAEVEAKGTYSQGGKSQPLEFVSAWVELYEKRDGRWVGIGNSSSFKE